MANKLPQTTEELERELIKRANAGGEKGVEAARQICEMAAGAIHAGRFNSLLLPFMVDCLSRIAEGVPPEHALWLWTPEPDKGGRPEEYDPVELAAWIFCYGARRPCESRTQPHGS
jgi:hypothetical protein